LPHCAYRLFIAQIRARAGLAEAAAAAHAAAKAGMGKRVPG
jgi:hypothetical protein